MSIQSIGNSRWYTGLLYLTCKFENYVFCCNVSISSSYKVIEGENPET